MNWLKNAAAQASQRLEATLQESGVSQKLAGVSERLAPVASVAQETKSLFSSLTSTLEESFNKASSGDLMFHLKWTTNNECCGDVCAPRFCFVARIGYVSFLASS